MACESHVLLPFLVDQAFVAPEVLAGVNVEGDLDGERAADVYSFGVVMYALEMARLNESMMGGRIGVPKKCDYYYGRLMKKCVSNDPLKRPSFEKIVEKLTKILI